MEKLWQPDCGSWKENAGYFKPNEHPKLPAYGLCFIAEEKENLNSKFTKQAQLLRNED